MANEIKVKVPDIGGATGVDVIEILVKPGDQITKDTSLITLESDKASMDIPSPESGRVKELLVKVGDKVSEGDSILVLEGEGAEESGETKPSKQQEAKAIEKPEAKAEAHSEPVSKNEPTQSESLEVRIPDIGGATNVDVIDVMVSAGQSIAKDQSLITLEGDKATMEIPSPAAGVIENVDIKVGDKVSQGSLILTMKTEAPTAKAAPKVAAASEAKPEGIERREEEAPKVKTSAPSTAEFHPEQTAIPAGPAVRRLAREFGINLTEVKGTGRKSRITKEDLQLYVKNKLSEKSVSAGGGLSLPAAPVIDFSKFGEIETKPLNKIKRLTGVNVHRSWITIPHVTQFDEADITELEAFRKSETENAKQSGYKLTMLAFVTKVVAKALAAYPQFNSSLDASGENLIYKRYFNIGIAVETANGLVVPVIKDVDRLSVGEVAQEMARLSAKARDKGLMPADMSGGCFTISSLGGIGGTAFTPIVNSPEVAILGLSRSSMKPVYEQGDFKARLMLPLSLSYDHRVIDGAEAARFTRFIADSLSDIRRILL
ncbi:dihydrolipoyllysine-residue acetyltransferase [Legionella jordanis]|uniref:Acetyltransferase component of pyruvate dehydrogenase complex n=1 Tax=Legionella jordanis TaxID=456 RepID=A0A0W0V7R8_9GAMM|nr:dihydrolipoyllysine-residue acetyltransferase [Legionella jordanis]KTD16163.1 pyruvate dehydrogenase E2 component [Legionella jordanis]RMX04611.1 dihydrolipoyllysine-residue acetyltransferase [Legionella jordanis]RMX18320.1 dihydrolipoyllysine-residue acetyltransferase [Legionella jordanis]VEH12377.1 pyruvate dehydrogenase E2 component [Legionella jordanis]HAT8713890.1 dihydrolipoyllysine-residue acetyltransferase [Legionella jordanis]